VIDRDPDAAQETDFDLIVVGGGVYGCMVALEAARRRLRPLLLERDDFGQHTSASWLRILHGGLRYLQKLDMTRHVESVRERRWFLRHFPDLVEPLPCLMPLYGRGLRRRSVLAVALATNDLLSAWRDDGVRADRALPRGRVLSADETRRRAPSVAVAGLEGGALWHDAVVTRPQRLLIEVLRWGIREGAVALNRVEAVDLEVEGEAVVGVRARDRWGGAEVGYRARCVVNCAGPWCDLVAERFGAGDGDLFRPSLAFNVLFDREPDFRGAIAVEADRPGARTYFLMAAYGGVLAGTHHAPLPDAGSSPRPPGPGLVDDFVDELDEAIPGLKLVSAGRRRLFWGQLPVAHRGSVDLTTREVLHDHGGARGPRGLVSVSGVKFTVARAVAERTLGLVERLGYVPPGAEEPVPPDVAPESRHVPGAEELLTVAARDREAALALVRALADEESALEPEDVLSRRTDWSLDVRHGDAVAELVRAAFERAPTDGSG
jgi:glycerol-3-phosphate dehydrogenase